MSHARIHCLVFLTLALFVGVSAGFADRPSSADAQTLARQILSDPNLPLVLEKAKGLLKTGFNAGSGYGEVWIRDLNTFLELSLAVNDPKPIRDALLTFFKFQGTQGDIVDGYIPQTQGNVGYKYRRSPLAPNLLAHKNTVETDQESSLVQAVRKYVVIAKDPSFLDEEVDGVSVRERLARALAYVLAHRFDRRHGLVWGPTTADWGDVQPEHKWGVELDENSHRALDIYDNAMFLIAIDDYLSLAGDTGDRSARWRQVGDDLRANVREHLWDRQRKKFRPHAYLEGSPFPSTFDEAEVYYHGGTAVAIEAGLLTRDEVEDSFLQMVDNVRRAGAGSIGLTLYPTYPEGSFKNASMGPYSYQNGGDWCWFGGRMIRQLIRYGFVDEAYRELQPMTTRVLRHGDFREWWSRDNQPRGSKQFRGSAGVLGMAIIELLAWAEQHKDSPDTDRLRKTTLWQIGKTDGNNAEFALAPNGWGQYKNDGFFVVGSSDSKRDWPYVQPGPVDSWAGSRPHSFLVLFGLKAIPTEGQARLEFHLVDTHSSGPPTLRVEINGEVFERPLPPGAGDASIFGRPEKGRRERFDIRFPARVLRIGDNEVRITTLRGSWMLYDSLELVAPDGAVPSDVRSCTLVEQAEAMPALQKRDGFMFQPVSVTLRHFGPDADAVIRLEGESSITVRLGGGLQDVELWARAVERETKRRVTITGSRSRRR